MVKAPSNWAERDREEVYVELDHPADLFLEITGTDLPTLLENALFALYDQMAVLAGFEARRELTITVREAAPPDALRALLAEALFRFETEGFVAVGAEVDVDERGGARKDLQITARLWGENADKLRHTLSTEVKAVTYHRLEVARRPGGEWRATVLFDV
jgi:SHS2 domain-containing protein